MADFTIRSSQHQRSLLYWLNVHYSDEYNDNLWERIAEGRDEDAIGRISTRGITSLVMNSYRIVSTGLHCRSRFEEAYAWCKSHDVKKVKNCFNDIEYAIAVCRGAVHLNGRSKEIEDIFMMTQRQYERDFTEGAMNCDYPYAYKDARGNCWLRCWFINNGRGGYDECEAYMIEMATRFDIMFDYFENPKSGDRIFTFGRLAQ